MNALGANKTIWQDTVASLAAEMRFVPGETLVACGFASYLGVFTSKFRQRAVGDFVDFLRERNVPLGNDPNPLSLLATDAEMASWNADG